MQVTGIPTQQTFLLCIYSMLRFLAEQTTEENFKNKYINHVCFEDAHSNVVITNVRRYRRLPDKHHVK